MTNTATLNGQPVRIISIDSDPSCDVWVVAVNDPDTSIFVPSSALIF